MSQAIYHPQFAECAFLINDLTLWVSEHLKVISVLSDVTKAFQPPAGDTLILLGVLHCVHHNFLTSASPALYTRGHWNTPGLNWWEEPPISRLNNSILPPSLSQGPGQRCLSVQASITSWPSSAVLASWPSATLWVNDDGRYGVLLALGGFTSQNKCNEYIWFHFPPSLLDAFLYFGVVDALQFHSV